MSGTHAPEGDDTRFYTKHAVIDAKRRVWGYDFVAGSRREDSDADAPADAPGIAPGSFVVQQALGRDKKIMAAFSHQAVLDAAPYALPPVHGVIKLALCTGLTAPLMTSLERLRADGYVLAMDCASPKNLADPAYALADIICWTQGQGEPPTAFVLNARGLKATLMAQDVPTTEEFERLQVLGFSLFQGPFLKQPEIVPGRTLTSHAMSRLTLLRTIEAPDPDFDALAEAIETDVAISFRLLTYLNSPSFGLTQKIQSIKQATVLLGWIKLKNWLRAVLVADMSQKNEINNELVLLSVQRGRFLELTAREYDFWGFDPATLFLLGLFSLLDAILGIPMPEAVEYLPLDDTLKAALLREPNNEYLPLIELSECLEEAHWEQLEPLTLRLSLDLGRIKGFFAQAMEWSQAFGA